MRALSLPALALWLAALAASPARGQVLAEGGARALALGRAATALDGEAWGEFNAATWGGLDRRQAGLFAGQAFGLSELRLAAASVALPTPVGTAALAARTYGLDDYRETRLALGFARALPVGPQRRLAVGLRADLHAVALSEGFGSTTLLALSAGAQADVLPGLRAGLAARNLDGLGRSDSTELRRPLSTAPALAVGLAYRPSERALVLADVEKDLDFPLAVRVGLEVQVVEAFALRVGAATGLGAGSGPDVPTRLSAGAGFRAGPLRADLAVERHDALGLSPAVSVGLDF